jgi:hypothetical protein
MRATGSSVSCGPLRPELPLSLFVLGLLLGLYAATGVPAWAQTPDPKPPQVSVEFFYPPSPLIQYGTPRLVYEMRISNYVPLTYQLDSIDVDAGSRKFTFSGDRLREMMRFFGEKEPAADTRSFQPGRSAAIYFMLSFDRPAEVPQVPAAYPSYHRA